MKRITDFEWIINKDRVFKILDCQPESPIYKKLDNLYQYGLKTVQEIISPVGVYNFIEIPSSFQFPKTENCKKVVFCLLTLGEHVDLKINKLFACSQYLEAILLDIMANEIIFNLAEQLTDEVILDAKKKGWGLTERMEPGSNVPLDFQKEILANLNVEDLNVSLTEKNMLIPLKSLTFFWGAGEKIKSYKKECACKNCSMKECKFRN